MQMKGTIRPGHRATPRDGRVSYWARVEDGTEIQMDTLTVRETAEVVGLSPGRVQEIETRALDLLKVALTSDPVVGSILDDQFNLEGDSQ